MLQNTLPVTERSQVFMRYNSDMQIQEVQGDVSGERQRSSATAVIAQVCKTHKDAQ